MAVFRISTMLLLASLSQGQDFPFRNPTLPWEERLDDLINRLTLEEMVLQMARGGAGPNGPAPPIERLGIGPFNWNTECLRGDVEAPAWATAFPQALGLAASFRYPSFRNTADGHPSERNNVCALCQVEERDWRMTFLPQFEACVQAGTFSFMCSYNRINGVPACANKKLLTDILRGEWGFQGYVVSDEGAIELIMVGHHFTQSFLETAIASVNAGCNLELAYLMKANVFTYIGEAVAKGNISLETVKARVRPLFRTRMRLGEFDPPAMNPYNALGLGDVATEAHRQLALCAAVQSFVLLKNQQGILPLKAQDVSDKTFAVSEISQHSLLNKKAIRDKIFEMDAIDNLRTRTDLESEGLDRTDLALPGHQLELLQDAVAWAAGRPVILLLFNAGPLDVSWAKANDGVGAILACFFPAQATGLAIAKVLVGADGTNPAGRLPATWPASMNQVPPMENYTMAGRTYRYYGDEAPLYPFGYGLSFTTFQYSDLILGADVLPICENLTVSVVVKNIGSRDGEEVVQLYLRWGKASVPVPRWQLVGFQRVLVPQGQAVKVPFLLSFSQRAVWAGEWQLEPGTFTLFVGGQQPFQETRAPSNILQADFTVSGSTRKRSQC
nr:uncharacterized protein LOC132781454 [Anolis sagrei ordinatus]